MTFNTKFKSIINSIDNDGDLSQPRDMKVKELMLAQNDFDPTKTIANFENRKFNWKYFAGELAWYLNQNRDVDYIGQFSGFWSTLTNPDSNEINSNYGSLLFGDQLQWVLDSLKTDKNTRQAIAFLNQPKFQFKGNKDFVCTMYLNFFIRDNKLNMKVQMRSNDIFYGLTFDAPYFSFIHQHMRLWLLDTYPELQLGTYYHCADNIHFYERHFEMSTNIISETKDQGSNYTMNIENPLFNLTKDNMLLTEYGINFMKDINEAVGNKSKQITYNNILREYLNIRLT
jgi:thymidylate synthase